MYSNQMFNHISSALEGAFAVVLAQNALLMSKPVVSIIDAGLPSILNITIILFTLINFLAITSNWVSCVVYSKEATSVSFFVDIITLGIFFTGTQIISDLLQTNNLCLKNLFLVTGVMYVIIHLLFITWNIFVLKKSRSGERILNITNVFNGISMTICAVYIVLSLLNINIACIIFIVGFAFWVFLIIYFLREVRKVV